MNGQEVCETNIPLADPMAPAVWELRRRTQDTVDTFTIELKRGREKFLFSPGQFNMLYAFGVGEVPISISGDPAKPKTLVHTIRSVGTVTAALEKMKKGALIGVRGPYGTSWPVDAARGKDLIIAAGGIGLAPLRPLIYHVLANRKNFNKVILLYGARTPGDLLFTNEFEEWSKQIEIHSTVDRAIKPWTGLVGVVTTLFRYVEFNPASSVAMVCGPEIMMRFTVTELQRRGVPDPQIYISMERNMKCAVGFCGHCQYGPTFICKDGPVFRYNDIGHLLRIREI